MTDRLLNRIAELVKTDVEQFKEQHASASSSSPITTPTTPTIEPATDLLQKDTTNNANPSTSLAEQPNQDVCTAVWTMPRHLLFQIPSQFPAITQRLNAHRAIQSQSAQSSLLDETNNNGWL